GRRRAASSGSSEGEPEPQRRAGAAAGPGRAGKELLSFGGEEEREGERIVCVCPAEQAGGSRLSEPRVGTLLPLAVNTPSREEFFKVKKPSFNEVTFRIKKKENLLPAQTEAEESKKICQLEPEVGNTKDTREEEENEDETYSSLNEDYSNSDSENESMSSQRRKDLSPGNIPSAAHIEAARKKRHLARTEADYLPLDVSNSPQVPQRGGSSDLESEDESETKNLDFAPKMRTLRQRMTEDMGELAVFLPEAL
ncbi:GCFC2 factor, partial [Bombycilla garrulus]|nr:GCFC2 factor [Bombycilla garrulus]